MTWLLVGLLGMIWAAFLLPSRKRSPTSSVEDFERRMSLLADANSTTPGRWVLMPRKGARLIGSRDRERVRARRRRRQIFMVLLDLTVLTLLMGLFPPFRVMLLGTGVLAFTLLAYSALLVKIREEEIARVHSRVAMARERAFQAAAAATPAARARARARATASARFAPPAASNGHSNGYSNGNGHSNGYSNGNGHSNGYSNGNGHSNGYSNGNRERTSVRPASAFAKATGLEAQILREGGVAIIDDDVHVIVGRAEDFASQDVRSAAR